jgi:RimJ/RimL family protein N-acetyltransferase
LLRPELALPSLAMTTLSTERLLLRPLAAEDLDALAAFYADPEVMRHVGGGRVLTHDETAASLERMMGSFERAGYGQWAVVEPSSGTFMGRAGILEWPDLGPSGETEIGYLLGRPHWGYGYATEAALAARDHALEVLGRRRLISLIDQANDRSARVAVKLGMAHEDDVELFGRMVRRFSLER